MSQENLRLTLRLFAMQLQVSALPDGVLGVVYTITGIVAVTLIITKLSKGRNVRKEYDIFFWPLTNRCQLDGIPTVGSGRWLGSWWSGHKFQTNAIEVVQEGYEKVSEFTLVL